MAKYIISSFNENDMLINEDILQNTVYKIKMSLNDNNMLYNCLPYYWYSSGSVNKTLKQSFMILKKFLTPVGDKFSFKKKDFKIFDSKILNIAPEIEDITYDLISNENYIYNDLTEDIYREFAPLNMIYTFRYDIFNKTFDDDFKLDGDTFVKSFRDCQYNIIPIMYLNDFSLIFTNFTRQIDILNDENLIRDKWDIIKPPIQNLYFTFAKALRCLKHDSYYDNKYYEWNSIYNDFLLKLKVEIDLFIKNSYKWIDLSKYSTLSDKERNFIAPFIDICLEG